MNVKGRRGERSEGGGGGEREGERKVGGIRRRGKREGRRGMGRRNKG